MQVAKNEGLDDMGRYMVQAMFLAGLKEEIRIKTMETRPVTHQEAYQTALNIECIMKDKRGAKPMVSSIQQAEEDADFEIDEEEEDLLSQINAIRMKRGRRPARFAPKGNSSKVNITCRYCKATGHFQRDCFKRKKENGKMIDAAGKPYKINPIEEEDSHGESNSTPQEEEQAVQSIRDMSLSQLYFGGINSIRDATGETQTSPRPEPPVLPLTTERCMCLKIWDIRKRNLDINTPENTAFLERHGMTSVDEVDEDKWICTCLEDMIEFRSKNYHLHSEWCEYTIPDAEEQEILEDTIQLRSEWANAVGDGNPSEDKSSKDSLSPVTNRCKCLELWDIQKQVLFIMSPEELTTYLARHGMTSADDVDEEYWICTCLEDMMEFRTRCEQQWCYYEEPDTEVQEILENTLELRSEWFDAVGEDNPFEDKASRDTPSPTLQSPSEDKASKGQDTPSLN
jgi:hypothetical protein